MYGDSQGSPDQASHFDPLEEPVAQGDEQTNVLPPMDVKVAGPPPGWSPPEIDRPASRGFSLPGGAARIGIVAGVAAIVVGGAAVGAVALTGGSGTAKKATTLPTQAALADPRNSAAANPQAAEEAARKIMMDRASKAARGDAKKGPPLSAKGASPSPSPSSSSSSGTPTAGNPMPSGQAQTLAKSMLSGFGWSPSTQFGCLVNLWNKESGWRVTAGNASGAYGIPQAKPGSKMSSAGADWRTSAKTQITWGFGYIKSRYGSPCGAWSKWQGQGWY